MMVWRDVLLILLVAFVTAARAEDVAPLRQIQTIALAGVEGRIDHLAVDLNRRRLFVAALGNNTVEVLDLQGGERIHTIRKLHEPQGVLFVPESNGLLVANGGSGQVAVFDGESFEFKTNVEFSGDADNIRYDVATKSVYVGYGAGGLGIIDAMNGTRVGDIELEGHPESFQLERSGSRIFVNVPTANHIAVVDRKKRAMIARWPIGDARANFPMAFDEGNHRLFVGFRKPSKLIVFDTESGRPVAWLDSAGDCDDIFYDARRRRVYMTCGEGFIDVFEQRDANHITALERMQTRTGARTSLFVPELNRLYLAAPRRGSHEAEIRVYEARP